MSATLEALPETMFGDAIAILRDDPAAGADERMLLSAAIAIRNAMPQLDPRESREVETILALGIHLWSGERRLCDHAWARLSSPFALRARPTDGFEATIRGACDEVHARIARFEAARAASADGSAARRLDEMMREQRALHPRLGLSFGYIGSCGCGGYDDRSWKIFAKLATPSCNAACDVSYGGYATAQLGKMMQQAERNLAAWCDEQERRLDAGEIRIVGSRDNEA